MADATTTDTTAQATSDGTAKTTGATGFGMQTASSATQEEHADSDQVTLSKAELEEMIERRLARDRKARAAAERKAQDAATTTTTESSPDTGKAQRALERAEAEREAATTALRAERVSRLAEREAGAAHAIYPEIVAGLLEKQLEFEDDSDKPTNLATLLGQFRRKYPLLFRTSSGDGGAGATAAPGTPMNSLIRQMAGRR